MAKFLTTGKKILTLFFGIIYCGFYSGVSFGQLSVTPNQTALFLAQKLAGPGIYLSNASLTCPSAANGFFTAAGSNLGLDSGIVLTTGHAAAVAGPEAGLTSFNNNTDGDASLSALAGASTTKDACKLEFDIVPQGDAVNFQYVFGSEEYINSTCGPYNDAFAFFISGPGISGSNNMATVPNANIPVTINSINSGIPGIYGTLSNCTSMGVGAPFTQYYINNQGGTTVAYRGFTTVLTAAQSVIPCDTYHLKLVIADAQNGLYDSGVFIEAGSLQTATFHVTATGTGTTNGQPAIFRGCHDGQFKITRSTTVSTPTDLEFTLSGTAINGQDYSTVPLTVTIPANDSVATVNIQGFPAAIQGTKSIVLKLMSPYNCDNAAGSVLDSAVLYLLDQPQISVMSADTNICLGDTAHLTASVNYVNMVYGWSPTAYTGNPTALNMLAYPVENTTYTITASLPGSGCDTLYDSIHIEVSPRPLQFLVGDDLTLCENQPITVTPVDSPKNELFIYHWSGPNNFESDGETLYIENGTPDKSGDYIFTIATPQCGVFSDTVYIAINPVPSAPRLDPDSFVFCLGTSVTLPLTVPGIQWYQLPGSSTPFPEMPQPDPDVPAVYTWYITQTLNNCESDKSQIVIRTENCCDAAAQIPNAFSPNGDGINDRWKIMPAGQSTVAQLEIYNRWGQKVYSASATADNGWDGTVNGQPAAAGCYYYYAELFCPTGKRIVRKGEIILIR